MELIVLNSKNTTNNDLLSIMLMTGIKSKIDNAVDCKEKLQLLTLIPNSWSHEYAADYFKVTVHIEGKHRNDNKLVRSYVNQKRTKGLEFEKESTKKSNL